MQVVSLATTRVKSPQLPCMQDTFARARSAKRARDDRVSCNIQAGVLHALIVLRLCETEAAV